MPNSANRFFWNDLIKRIFDITISSLGLLALAPFFAYIAIRIQHDSPGPVFYWGKRLGKGDKPFMMVKFRTMREEAQSYAGPRLTAHDDQRITALGKWLRDSKINELPQLWNVIKGDMSLVGPRPEDPALAVVWPLDVRAEVLSVRPGITSPASVLYRDEESMLSSQTLMTTYLGEIMPSKLRLDQLYVRRRSLLVDLDVLFWTFAVLLPWRKQLKPLEEYLFRGPLSRLVQRYINWFMLDLLTTLIALVLTSIFWDIFAPFTASFLQMIFFVAIYSLIFSISGAFSGIQRVEWRYAAVEDVLDLIFPTLLAGILTLLINYFTDVFPLSMLLSAVGLTFAGYTITRYRRRLLSGLQTRWFDRRGVGKKLGERVLIVGAGETGQFAAWSLMNVGDTSAFQVVGFVDDQLPKQPIHVVGKWNQIRELVERYDAGVIIYAVDNLPSDERQQLLEQCQQTRARTVIWPDALSVAHSAASPSESQPTPNAAGRPTTSRTGMEQQLEEQVRAIRAALRQNT